jgi:hypothetical protein
MTENPANLLLRDRFSSLSLSLSLKKSWTFAADAEHDMAWIPKIGFGLGSDFREKPNQICSRRPDRLSRRPRRPLRRLSHERQPLDLL